MTMPYERTRAIIATKTFLESLLNRQATPRVPSKVRAHARSLLRHYPSNSDVQHAHMGVPWLYGSVLDHHTFLAEEEILSNWRLLSENFFTDALNSANDIVTREDCALDGGYFAALLVLGVAQGRGFDHPSGDALKAAADALGWPPVSMSTAIALLEKRYDLGRDGRQFDEIFDWAHRIREALRKL